MENQEKGADGTREKEMPYYRVKEVIERKSKNSCVVRTIEHWKEFREKDIFTNRNEASKYFLGRYFAFTAPDSPEWNPHKIPGDRLELNPQKGDNFTCEVYLRFPEGGGRDVYILGDNVTIAVVGQNLETEFLRNMHIETMIQGQVNRQANWHTQVVNSN